MTRNISTEEIKYMKVSTLALPLSEDLPFVQKVTGTEAGEEDREIYYCY